MSRCSNSRSSTSLFGGSPGGTFGIPSSEDDEDDVRLVGEYAGELGLLLFGLFVEDRDRGRGGRFSSGPGDR